MGEHPRDTIYLYVEAERQAQDRKWGEQNHPDGTGDRFAPESVYRRQLCEYKFAEGTGTWRDIFLEEAWEALAETDPAKLRTELTQVAAVCVAWIEALDRRAA